MGRKRIAVIDCETDPFTPGVYPRPFVWGYADDKGFRYWWGPNCTDDCAQFLQNLWPASDVYAHNGGKFDFWYLASYLAGRRRIRIHQDRLVSAPIGRTRLIDSWPILPFGLGTAYKRPIDYNWFREGFREAHRQEILAYLRDDCETLLALVTRFRLQYGPQLTLASAGFKWLRDTVGPLPPGNKRFDEQFRGFYFGGRIEAVQTGVEESLKHNPRQWWYIDQNGAYANAMRSILIPRSHTYRTSSSIPTRPDLLERSLISFEGLASGSLPVRSNVDGTVHFPDRSPGLYTFHVTGHELMAAMETQSVAISKVIRVYTFLDTLNLEPWVSQVWELLHHARKTGDTAGAHFYKTMLTAVSGKFGQRGDQGREYYLFPWHPQLSRLSELTPGGRRAWEYCGRFNRWWLWAKPRPVEYFHNVAVSAMITGFVRARMWRALLSAKDVRYIDTDGIICSEFDPEEGIGTGLGQWKREGPFRGVAVGAPKLYALWNSPNLTQPPLWSPKLKNPTVDWEDVVRVVNGKPFIWRSHAPTYSVSRGRFFHARSLHPARVPGSEWYLARKE